MRVALGLLQPLDVLGKLRQPLADLLFHDAGALEDPVAAVDDRRGRGADLLEAGDLLADGLDRRVHLGQARRLLGVVAAGTHRQRPGEQQAGAQAHVGGRVLLVPQHDDVGAIARQFVQTRRRGARRVHEQAHRGRAVAPRLVGLVERRLQGAGAARLGLDDDGRAGAGRIGAQGDDEVAGLAARDHARGVADGVEHVAGGEALRLQLLADALLEVVAVQGRAARLVAPRGEPLEQGRDTRLELARAIVLRALEAVEPLHDARQAGLGVVERELRADLPLRLLDAADQPRQRRVLVVERELADHRGDALAQGALEVAMALLQLAHEAAQRAVGAVERELAGDGIALQGQRLRHLAAQRGHEGVALLGREQGAQGTRLAQVLREQLVERCAAPSRPASR